MAADCRSSHDDTVLTGQITDSDDTHLRHEIKSFVQWCDKNSLELNVCKIKEMLIDLRRNITVPDCVVIKGVEVERVETYKYLGVVFDNGLSWKVNTNTIVKRAHTQSYYLRKLRSFDISPEIVQMFFTCSISSVLTFNCVCWGRNISKHDRDRLVKIIKKAESVIGKRQNRFDKHY